MAKFFGSALLQAARSVCVSLSAFSLIVLHDLTVCYIVSLLSYLLQLSAAQERIINSSSTRMALNRAHTSASAEDFPLITMKLTPRKTDPVLRGVRYGRLGFNVPLDTVYVISETGALSSDVHLPFSNGGPAT